MPSPTVENYLKRIYALAETSPQQTVPMGEVAQRLKVVPGTATTMVKALQRENWLHYQPRKGVRLTAAGQREALRVLRKHRILEMFLVEVLQLDWTEVHREAEVLEHALSHKLVQKMDAYLGYPETDPHGDPIPTADGQIRQPATIHLHEADPQQTYRVARILQQDADFLNFLHQNGIVPDCLLEVTQRCDAAGTIQIALPDQPPLSLSLKAASAIRVASP